ncbi:MAG: formamidopyrimidine-DNA glycosylase [Deltaproteobacteria bacterium]|nr:formamidopyrimidine-DNA glycosylase [Deltaproteobacteria bacterium]
MPELPDVEVYLEKLGPRVVGAAVDSVTVRSAFVVRSFEPPLKAIVGRKVTGLRRVGKRIVFELHDQADELFLVIHLMIAGRLRWRDPGVTRPAIAPKLELARFGFARGTLFLTEASTRKRASIHLVRGAAALAALDPGGLEPMGATLAAFQAALTRENHTIKRALTDPHLLSGIGNAYSDEILHRARMSPVKLTKRMVEADFARLLAATHAVLGEWTARLSAEVGDGFPEKVTAFRDEMAVHGRFGKPCPDCGAPVQRIVHAANESNYCARCQTGGKLLADRALSRLLREDWPRTLEELEEGKLARRGLRDTEPGADGGAGEK